LTFNVRVRIRIIKKMESNHRQCPVIVETSVLLYWNVDSCRTRVTDVMDLGGLFLVIVAPTEPVVNLLVRELMVTVLNR
jgi:hypothetical protein